MGFLVLAGFLAEKQGSKNIMRWATIITCAVSYPLMSLIQSGHWIYIIGAKIIFTILTAMFIGPFHAWAQAISSSDARYKNVSTSYVIGKCFSTILLACSFLVYDHFKNIALLGVILSLIALMTIRIFKEPAIKKENKVWSDVISSAN